MKNFEVDTINFSEVSEIISDLKSKYKNRLEQNCIPLILKSELRALIEEGQIHEKYCMGHICNFYSNIVEYLNRYSEQYTNFKVFSYMKLTEVVSWNIVQDRFQYFIENISNDLIKEDELFDEISYLSNYVTSARIEKWTQERFTTVRRWLEVFKFLKDHNLPFNNCLILAQYMLAVPGTNSPGGSDSFGLIIFPKLIFIYRWLRGRKRYLGASSEEGAISTRLRISCYLGT